MVEVEEGGVCIVVSSLGWRLDGRLEMEDLVNK